MTANDRSPFVAGAWRGASLCDQFQLVPQLGVFELKSLMPDDAEQAIGHGTRAKRSKSGAISFDLIDVEGSHAAV